MDLYETVLALFCDPEGNPCMDGSEGDRIALKAALDKHRQPVSAALEALERFNELVKLQKTKKDAYNAHNILLYDRTRNTIDVLFQKLLKDHRDTIKQALAQAGGQDDECFDIGDMVQISPNNPYYEDWKGVTLEIVGIYRDRGSKYQSPNTPPPIRYSVKDVKDGWTYGYTDDFSFEDLVAAPVSAKEG